MAPKARKSQQKSSSASKIAPAKRTLPHVAPIAVAVAATVAAAGASFYWKTLRLLANVSPASVEPHSIEAVRLAALINSGAPTNVAEHMSPSELEKALGELHPTAHGWRRRVGSFIDLLDQNPAEQWEEDDLAHVSNDVFAGPLIVRRTNGGISSIAAEHMTVAGLRADNPATRPSRCAALAVNFGPKPRTADGEWNTDMMPSIDCPECKLSFGDFADIAMRPFDLSTPANDDRNTQLQTHGVNGQQLPWLDDIFKKRAIHHKFLDREYFHPYCYNPPAMGFAGSLRGLPFHSHQANWNEAVVGRKLFAFFPPRTESHSDNLNACPFPPWKPNGAEVPEPPIEAMLESFFEGSFNASKASSTLGLTSRSCHDQSMTAIQWLVYELPKLPKEHRPLLFVLHPGELVWIPDNWLHFTVNVDDAVYTFAASCPDLENVARFDPARLSGGVRRVCERTGRFCEGYCHSVCRSCDGRQCDCPAIR
eukprot:TRINITY_DN22147_c0_g1_i1.p1 TRINITY_DN22147_c0_g1~~TRINITY_DN22147_c0_g1_i1.p1  ORF type:complete len:495 (-),score=54.53 TRINITY_DN22147_c0_g1_i1:576-2015(-)